mgnify:CR=1 FL=1
MPQREDLARLFTAGQLELAAKVLAACSASERFDARDVANAVGKQIDEPTDITSYWRDDLVAFVTGCSFSFEELLMRDGLSIRHIEAGTTVPMYRTNIACASVGPFGGPMIVSMRPFKPKDAIRAIEITSGYPQAHGAPIHFGNPQAIGVRDIGAPDFGDPVAIADGEVPVFWACGVTLQQAVEFAKPAFAITHAPGRMIVTDIPIAR